MNDAGRQPEEDDVEVTDDVDLDSYFPPPAQPALSSSLEYSNQTGSYPKSRPKTGDSGIMLEHDAGPCLAVCAQHGLDPGRPVTYQEGAWRHSGWAHQRLQVWKAMQALHLPSHRMFRFANCGSGAFVEAKPSQAADGIPFLDVRVSANCCHDRLCQPCQSARAFAIYTGLQERMAGKDMRFLTLTLRCNGRSLDERLDRLYSCFTQLRHRKFWKDRVTGGCAFCEVTTGKTPDFAKSADVNWHVHLHILVAGSRMDQKELSDQWHSVTGDSYIVHITAVDESHSVQAYLTKYVVKAAPKGIYDHQDRLEDFILAMRGRRMCLTFGDWRGTPLKPKAPSKEGWKLICSLTNLLTKAVEPGSIEDRVLFVLRNRYPHRFTSGVVP